MLELPLVSIVIPNLHSPILDKTISAVETQRFDNNYEIIVVGQDRFGYAQKRPNIKFIETPVPVSPAVARNLGVQNSGGEYIAFTDADCVPEQDWLHQLVSTAQENDWSVLGGGVNFPQDNFWTFADNVVSFYPYLFTAKQGEREQIPSLNLLIHRSIFLEIGGFDERYPFPAGEDSDLCIRLRIKGYPLYFHPGAVVTHLPQRGSFKSLLDHAYTYGRFSVKVDQRYQHFLKTPFTLRYWWAAILFSPIMAAGVMIKMLPVMRNIKFLTVFPLAYFVKIVWCFGAAKTLKNGSPLNRF